MAKRNSPEELPEPELVCPADEALSKLQKRVDLGEVLAARNFAAVEQLEGARHEYYSWSEFNETLLKKLFTNGKLAAEYSSSIGFFSMGKTSFAQDLQAYRDDVRQKIRRLKSIQDRIPLFDKGRPEATGAQNKAPVTDKRVFVVHGRDEQLKTEVARLLERLGFEAVVLHEQANRGRTIIEKFVSHADVGFAIVLLTPDDVGAVAPCTEIGKLQARARQNVVFELGFFLGALGRDRVAALRKGSLEDLSDIAGVIYTPVDTAGAWKYAVAKELKAAGYADVDFNRIV